MSVMSICSRVFLLSSFSLLICSLIVLSIIEYGILKYPAIISELAVYPFYSVNVCFTYFGILMFINAISFWQIDTLSLYSVLSFNTFAIESILSDISIVTLLVNSCMGYLFQSFHFQPMHSFSSN